MNFGGSSVLAHMRRLQHRRIMLKLTARNSQCSKFLYSILLKETRKQLSCYAHVHFLVYGKILSPDVWMRMVKNSIHFTLILNIIIHIEQSGCRVRLGERGVWYWVGLRVWPPYFPINLSLRHGNTICFNDSWTVAMLRPHGSYLYLASLHSAHMHIHFISKEKLDTTF